MSQRLEIKTLPMDTVRLKFSHPKLDSFFFKEQMHSKQLKLTGSRFVWTNNTWRKEQRALGFYVPKYWIQQDFINPNITHFYFEGSLPKLLQAENVTPLKTNQCEGVAKAISNFCKKVGVFIFPVDIKNAIPTLVAIGENINITDYFSCNNAIRVLKPFDYKTHSDHRTVEFTDHKHGGKEAIFSQDNETTKAYDKSREIQNTSVTTEEKEIAELIKTGKYRIDGKLATEILRIELTAKTKRKISTKFKPYLGELPPTFENLFNDQLWTQVLKDEVNKVFNHPLQKIIFLSLESQPMIDTFLDQHYHHIQTKDTVRGIIASLQERGLADTRKDYLTRYKSRQTWYNYLKRLIKLQEYFDWSALAKLDNVKIHNHILGHFGIITQVQQQLGLNFNTQLSK